MNPSKCKCMFVSKKHKGNSDVGGVQLYLGGMALGEVDSFKYLGVFLHKHLTWSEHISGICNKAKQILGLFYRQFYNNSSSASLKQLYSSLVRPHLEYTCQLWDPYTQNDINKLESVQKFALKLISHRWDASYEELTRIVNVPMLSKRRLRLKLAQVYKIIHGLRDFPDDIFISNWHTLVDWPGTRPCTIHLLGPITTTAHLYPAVSGHGIHWRRPLCKPKLSNPLVCTKLKCTQ